MMFMKMILLELFPAVKYNTNQVEHSFKLSLFKFVQYKDCYIWFFLRKITSEVQSNLWVVVKS